MPSVTKAVHYSWIPRGAGKGGQFSNATSHDADTDYMSVVQEAIVDGCRWVPRSTDSPYVNTVGNFAPISVFIFNHYASVAGHGATAGSINSWVLYSMTTGNIIPMHASGVVEVPWNVIGTGYAFSLPNAVKFQAVKNRCYAANGSHYPQILHDTGTGQDYLFSTRWGLPTPPAPLTYTLQDRLTGTCTVVNGNAQVTNITFGCGGLAAGMPFFIAGVRYVVSVVNVAGPPATVTMTTVYAGVGAAGVACQANFGPLDWSGNSGGYKYAYSYYSTVTGHSSNMSPVLQVNDGAPDNERVGVLLGNVPMIPGTTLGQYYYDSVVIWRSALGGGELFPLAVSTTPGVGFTTWLDGLADDTQLGTVGPGHVAGPNFTNGPPPDDLDNITYWDSRFWGSSASQPGLIFYSASVLDAPPGTGVVGVPEECWPLRNTMVLPESDGVITGMRTVGASILILTQNNIYTVVGQMGSYRAQRVSAKGAGGSHFATATLPGEDAQSGDILVHYGNDGRIYLLYGAGGDIPISYPIQDQFGSGIPSTQVSLGVIHAKQATYIAAQFHLSGYTYLYDLDRKIWFSSNMPTNCITEGLMSGQVTTLTGGVMAGLGTIFNSMLGVAPTLYAINLYTHSISPPGALRRDNKELQAVIIYTSDYLNAIETPIVVDVLLDETAPVVPLTRITASADPRLQTYFESPDARIYVSQGRILGGRLFKIHASWNATSFNTDIREIKAIWSYTTDDAGTGAVL